MIIPTEDQLFNHSCQFKDMKLSAFNPKTLTYYCQVCGGKLIIEKDMKDWGELFGEPITLKLNKKVLIKVIEDRDLQARMEEEIILKKEQEAMQRAEEARQKIEEARKQEEEEKMRVMEEMEKEAQEAQEASGG
ncbi:MAG: hypothetical protein K8T10_16130 [Candidatus Eremiobacteraeota bacterium]|nr:hypothetical protein [Candidatus Eremiobacteraeota bacterium]